jgi:hypothetical protein
MGGSASVREVQRHNQQLVINDKHPIEIRGTARLLNAIEIPFLETE